MSTPDNQPDLVEPVAPVSKNKRKKAAAAKLVEPIEPEPEIIADPYYPGAIIVDEGYSGWTLAKGIVAGVGVGATLMTLLFGYIRAKEIQRVQQEMFIAEALVAGQPPRAPPRETLEVPPS